jgi:hypothetical protein
MNDDLSVMVLGRGLMALGLCVGMTAATAYAQGVPPEAIQQFQDTIGNRVEAATIVGGDFSAAGGIYTFRGGTLATLTITRLGGSGSVAAAKPLGASGLKWAPLLLGNLGRIVTTNEYTDGYLEGNGMEYDVLAAQLGGGIRLYVTEHVSAEASISGIYGRVVNEFQPHNAVGDAVNAAASGTFVDWELDTWTVAPLVSARYEWYWGRSLVGAQSRFTFFDTETITSSSVVVDVAGTSQTWDNRLDLDVPLNAHVLGRRVHTGGFFSRTELAGGIADGMNEDHVYTVNGRLVLDYVGAIWMVRWLGLGVSKLWGDHVDGWTGGLDMAFEF